jgi:hypothetical protein
MNSPVRKLPIFALTLMVTAGLLGCGPEKPAVKKLPASNPFSQASTLPYGSEPIDKIKDADFKEAIDVGIDQENAEIDAIVNSKEKPTFDNTIVALDKSGALLGRANSLFQQLISANTNDTLDKINEEETPKLQAHQDSILLNEKLFARVKAIYDARDSLKLDDDQKFLVTSNYRRFVHSGAELPAEKKKQLSEINEQIAKLSNDYRTKLQAAGNEAALLVDSKEQLDGLSEADLAAAASAAKKAGQDGKYLLVIRNTTQQPLLGSLKNRDVRLKLMQASETRGEHDHHHRPAARPEGRADGLCHLCRLHRGGTDGQDRHRRQEAAAGSGPRRRQEGQGRGRRDPGRNRQAEGRLQADRRRLEPLCRPGAQGQVLL